MTSKERVLQREHDRGKPVGRVQGKADALDLAQRAEGMDGTAIIAEEEKVPAWSENAVYTAAHVGFPVQDDGQVYTILMPHTPANNPGSRPADLRAIYSLLHTKDPAKAKPYLAPNGTSGMYMTNEVCTKDGPVWRSKKNDNPYPPGEVGTDDYWEIINDN